jgi:hypothetical protein
MASLASLKREIEIVSRTLTPKPKIVYSISWLDDTGNSVLSWSVTV